MSWTKKYLQSSSLLSKLVQNTGWLFFEKAIRYSLSFFVGLYVARYLGPHDFGRLSYVISFIEIGLPIAALGFSEILVQEFTQKTFNEDELLGTGLLMRLLGTLLVYSTLYVVYALFFHSDSVVRLLLIVFSVATLFRTFDVLDFYFQSRFEVKYPVLVSTSAVIFSAMWKLFFIWTHKTVFYFGLAYLFEYIVLGVGFLLIAHARGIKCFRWKFNLEICKHLLSQCWPLILSGVMVSISLRIDQLMLKPLQGEYFVGQYAAAVKISEFFYVIPAILSTTLLPMFYSLYKENKELYLHRLKSVMCSFFWGFIFLGLIVQVTAPTIVSFLYGQQFHEAAGPLVIHIYSGMAVAMGSIFSHKFVLDKTTIYSFWGSVAGALSNIGLNMLLIPYYGMVGAAMATLISYVIPVFIVTFFCDRSVGRIYLQSIFYFAHVLKFLFARKS
ncbi:MAG: flippase [Bdellovibrionota bacterium]